MHKGQRQAQIRRLITETVIERQEDFVSALAAEGVPVTQATISRDIKEMQLVKVPTTAGHYRYSLPPETQLPPLAKLQRTFASAYLAGDRQNEMLALRFQPGTAPAIGDLIDQLADPRIFTTVSNDAKILIVCKTPADAQALFAEFEQISR
ncbi:arginine repressor [Lacticaseibacillus brantae]|uniref:Arginine repressor n=1 Tax=Lacticaseibacillus brantae DSM 23927 TaxID=1423727 RepID=A0A0R2B0S5_9LACO|nr:hypothetical protein [Lacticaseibacillus brantae]KRM72815.1 arginine repressor [Lacticaseibacillus brantae DSM 23927]